MEGNSAAPRKAQLDKEEREHLEDVVTEMRDRVEANVRYQLEEYDLKKRPDEDAPLSDEEENLVEAIKLEAVDGNDWDEGYEQYITGVGYTIVNRLAALRCMEVRNFIDDEVTRFRDDGLTPAADRLVTKEFMLEEEAVLEAYRNACEDLAEEIEILFDRSSAYSLIDPDDDTYEDLCGMLDEVSDEVWRADDVLGWVYEYYNSKLLDELRKKADRKELTPQEVPAANQFYTPHWVVRMLTDNSLGKMYLESIDELSGVVESQSQLTASERKGRSPTITDSPEIGDLCTYLVPSKNDGNIDEFDDPSDISLIDPACGSGHFLLYAFDVLERIWRSERPDLDHREIPSKILENNLYGVDLDMRACQLAAFNLYLKARTRTEAEGATNFEMPEVGIVCADAKSANIEVAHEVFDEVAGDRSDLREALQTILESFEDISNLGSLLNIKETLQEQFDENAQLRLDDEFGIDRKLSDFLHRFREEIDQKRDSDSFLAQDLKSFVRLLDILSRDYDIALMNPPYGSKGRMPDSIEDYINSHYKYSAEFYINFFEVCDNITRSEGRIGMIVPRTFLFKDRYEEFRVDFVGEEGSFDFLAEYGNGVMDNATVRTVGTVVRSDTEQRPVGSFYRLHDVDSIEKENIFLEVISGEYDGALDRSFNIPLSEFKKVPRTTICYSIPEEVRELNQRETKLDAKQAGVEGESICRAVPGVQTSDDDRFARYHWEVNDSEIFEPISKGGENAWIIPQITETVEWGKNGTVVRRSSTHVRTRNEEYYGDPGLTWTYVKETGRRFGYYPGGLFSVAGFMLFPIEKTSLWKLMPALNSDLYHCLFLSQTTDRFWNAGEVGSVPWLKELEEANLLEEFAREQYQIVLKQRQQVPISPYYSGPGLMPSSGNQFFYDHPHTNTDNVEINDSETQVISPSLSITKAARKNKVRQLKREQRLEEVSRKIDDLVYQSVSISEDVIVDVQNEIAARTAEDPSNRKVPEPETISEVPDDLEEQIKSLIHHLAVNAVREENDGTIPLEGTEEQADMLDRIVEQFEDAYGDYAEARLVEVDDILGAESADDEAYPNLRSFIEDDLFAYHVDTMENTPIIWKLSSERLLADAKGEGFACFVDYHQLDASLFDRLSNQYLEPRKAELRDHRSAANQRRNDESLSTSERADATEEFEFCSSALEQIAELEEVMQELGSTSERDFDDDDRERVSELAPRVAAFREETAERIETLAELREMNGEEWFQDTFSDGFWDKVDEWRDEWLDALEELEHACEEYAKPSDEPVEAHLADLFDYFNWRLKGSDHYSSTGILFMTYYFEREGADLLNEDGEPFEKLTEDERMLASLATGVDDASIIDEEYLEHVADDEDVDDIADLPPLAEFKALAEEIDDRCQTVDKRIPSDWSDRALSEITTAGYQPNQKHGVAINVTPLAEKSVVPEIVEDKVL